MTIYQKLEQARKLIKESQVRKDARNEYSKFDYFTPEYIEGLVAHTCAEVKLLPLCSLRADEWGLFQELTLVDLEDEEKGLRFEMRTVQNEGMTATSPAQQMGATDTYSERYIKMKVFGIKENSLDPDANSGKPEKAKPAVDPVLVKKHKIVTLLKDIGVEYTADTIKDIVKDKTKLALTPKNYDTIIERLEVIQAENGSN